MDQDLSLIEFSEEDDTLLPQISSNETANVNKYLSCSPLVRSAKPPHASKLVRMVDEHAPKSIRASPGYKFNKENIGANKPEVSNVSNVPQQTKRSTKGGGYNLRKSIAWNRAFFTDAGVLDPSELSLISGAFNNSSGGALSSVQEEGSSSMYSDSVRDSAALEENLSKEFIGSNKKKGRGTSTCLSPKCGSSARHKASPSFVAARKALSDHDGNRSGSKRGGYSRPLASPSASPSQKRPANASTTKAVVRELKIPVMKSTPRSLPASTRSATLTKQSVGRALPVHKDVGFKAASNSKRILERGTKTGPGSNSLSSKPYGQPLRRNMTTQTPLSTNLQYPKVANSSSPGLIPAPEIQANTTQASNADDVSTTRAVPLQHNPKNAGGSIQSGQLQVKKPSSLRMPSPSLGYFSQSKASGSHSLSESAAPPCQVNQCIPRLPKLGSRVPDSRLRPPRAPGKKVEVVNDAATVKNLSGGSNISSLVNFVSQEKIKLNLQKSDKILQLIHEHAEPSKIKNLSFKGNGKMEVGEIKILKSRSYDQLEINKKHIAVNAVCVGSGNFSSNEMEISESLLGTAEQVIAVSQIKLITEHQQVDDKKNILTAVDHDSFAEDESQPRNDLGLIIRSTSNLVVQPEQDDFTKSCLVEASGASIEENNVTQSSDCILFHESVSSETWSNIDTDNASLVKSEFEILNLVEPVEINSVSIKSHGVESDSMKLSTHGVDSQSLMSDGVSENLEVLPELQNSCLVKEDCHEMHLTDVQVELESEFNCSVEELHMELLVDNSCLFSDSQSLDVISSSGPAALINPNDVSNGTHDVVEPSADQLELLGDNSCLFSDSQSVDVISSSGPVAIINPNDVTNGTHDVDEPFADQLELTNYRTCGSDHIIPDENEKPQAINNKLIEENSYFGVPLSGYKSIDEANEMGNMTENSHSGDAKVQSLDDNQCIEDFNINLTNSIDHHDDPAVSFYVNGHPCSSFDETRKRNIDVPGSGEFVESKCSDGPSRSELKGAGVPFLVPLLMQEINIANVDKTTSLPHVENMLEISIESETFVENQTNLADAQASGNAENLKEFHFSGEEAEILTQIMSQKADSGSYLYDCYEKNHMLHRNLENLPEQTLSFEKIQKDDRDHVTDISFNVRNCGSEPESSPSSSQHNSSDEANEFANRKEIQLSDENLITESLPCNQSISEMHNQLIGDAADAKEVSKEILNESSQVLCNLSNEQPLLHQNTTRMKKDDRLEEVGIQNSSSTNSELTNKRDNVHIPAEDYDATMQLKRSGNNEKQEALVIKPPPNVIPFSDEWLAAIEAAGEDILTMKTGAVQHSPTEKSVIEPNPYSPVKRKNNQGIGPFDCTKFTNTAPQDSH